MKNQYFGDINDYHKYGLLRALTAAGDLSLSVCWMLTEDDGRRDGGKIRYLREPGRWRRFDPPLFDALQRAVADDDDRSVERIESSGLLDGAGFCRGRLTDGAARRRSYFDAAWQTARGREFIFFDPDNGVEVPSVRCGRRGSRKYIYYHELVAAFEAGHSLLVYQHFPRVQRSVYTPALAGIIRSRTRCRSVISLATGHVLFLLATRPEHAAALARGVGRVRARWGRQFEIVDHVAPMVTSTGCGAGS